MSRSIGIDPAVALLRTQAASGGQPATMASPPTITDSAGAITIGGAVRYDWTTSNKFLYLNGAWAVAGAGFPDDGYGIPSNTFYGGSTYVGSCGAVEFDFPGDAFEVVVKGTGTKYRVLVNGEVAGASPTYPADGGTKVFKVAFASSASRRIRIEASSNRAYFAAIWAASAPSKPSSYSQRLIIIGDSFTEGTGVTLVTDGLSVKIAQELGYKDFWNSGSGGTGWVNPGTGRTSGFDRWTVDVVNRAPTMVILLLGLNDNGTGNDALIQSTLPTKLAELRAAYPNCLVHVCGIFDVSAPSGWGAGFESVNNAIIAGASGLPRVWTHNLKGISYTKADSTHPDTAGHTTLYKAIYNKIAAVHGLHTVA